MRKPFANLIILISLLLAACGAPAATVTVSTTQIDEPAATQAPTEVAPTEAPAATATAKSSGPLTVLIDNDEGPITPANFNTFIGFWMIGWVYDSLYIRTPELDPIPALATSATPDALAIWYRANQSWTERSSASDFSAPWTTY